MTYETTADVEVVDDDGKVISEAKWVRLEARNGSLFPSVGGISTLVVAEGSPSCVRVYLPFCDVFLRCPLPIDARGRVKIGWTITLLYDGPIVTLRGHAGDLSRHHDIAAEMLNHGEHQ